MPSEVKYNEEGYQVDDAGEKVTNEAGEFIVKPDPASQGNEEVEIKGVKYTQDGEGNYLLNGVPVMDSKQVPFYNRARELGRKETEHQQAIGQLQGAHEEELERVRSEAAKKDPLDTDPATGLTYGALATIKKDVRADVARDMKRAETQNANIMADQNIDTQLLKARQNPAHRSFFANKAYEAELVALLKDPKGLSLPEALDPLIVDRVIKNLKGEHHAEIVKVERDDARSKALEGREIVGEVELGKSSGVSQGKRITVTPEITQLAKDGKMSLELAAGVIKDREERREKNKAKEGS